MLDNIQDLVIIFVCALSEENCRRELQAVERMQGFEVIKATNMQELLDAIKNYRSQRVALHISAHGEEDAINWGGSRVKYSEIKRELSYISARLEFIFLSVCLSCKIREKIANTLECCILCYREQISNELAERDVIIFYEELSRTGDIKTSYNKVVSAYVDESCSLSFTFPRPILKFYSKLLSSKLPRLFTRIELHPVFPAQASGYTIEGIKPKVRFFYKIGYKILKCRERTQNIQNSFMLFIVFINKAFYIYINTNKIETEILDRNARIESVPEDTITILEELHRWRRYALFAGLAIAVLLIFCILHNH